MNKNNKIAPQTGIPSRSVALPLSAFLLLALAPNMVFADAKTDGSVGAIQTLSGKFTVPQTLGTIKAGNLFHSFQNFSINTGESANFTTTSALQNVIVRVTGGTTSNINGALQVSFAAGSAPNFYFINPAGVTFGAGASVDVPGGFHVSTAHYLKFSDGEFHADLNHANSLSAAAPEAFGFLSASQASIIVRDNAKIETAPKQAISLVANAIEVSRSTINSQAGDIRVLAVGAASQKLAQEVSLQGKNEPAYGNLTLANGAELRSSGRADRNDDSGKILLSGGAIQIGDADNFGRGGITSEAQYGSGNGGAIDILATNSLSIMNGHRVSSATYTSGNAGPITAKTGALSIDGLGVSGTGFFSSARDGTGNAADIQLFVNGDASIVNSGAISAESSTASAAGNIMLTANNLNIDAQQRSRTGIFNSSGTIDVRIADTLLMTERGLISTVAWTPRDAGAINISAKNIVIDGKGENTGIRSNTNDQGKAGAIVVNVTDELTMLNGAQITADTTSLGSASSVLVNARDILMDGQGNLATISSDVFSNSAGNSGTVNLHVSGQLSLLNGATISASTNSYAASSAYTKIGNAGALSIYANKISLDGNTASNSDGQASQLTGFFATANQDDRSAKSMGSAGLINVFSTTDLRIANGAQISTSTGGGGNAGTILVNADTVRIDGIAPTSAPGAAALTGIFSDARLGSTSANDTFGNAGAIKVNATSELTLRDAAQISARSFSATNSGTVRIKTARQSMSEGAFIGPLAGVSVPASEANVKTDGSLGAVQAFSGDFTIAESLGTVKSGNLFHSFDKFSLTNLESATFTTTSNLQNVIARVTGGTASSINGVLQLSPARGSAPNFFFINPAGITFGAGAMLDVPAGLHFSTGNYLKFGAGNFYADLSHDKVLVDGAPLAFGFLGSSRASLVVKNDAELSTKTRQAISLVGGDILIDHATVDVLGGAIRIAAIGSTATEIGFSGALPKTSGNVEIRNNASITSHGSGDVDGGSVTLSAGNLLVDGQNAVRPTGIFSIALDGAAKSGNLSLSAAETLSIVNGGTISSSSFAAGSGGLVKIDSAKLFIDGSGGQTGIFSQAYGTGNAGTVDVTVSDTLSVLNRGLVTSSTYSNGNAGSVQIQTKDLILNGGDASNNLLTGILSVADGEQGNTGNAGKVNITASGKISLFNKAEISSATYTAGNAGDIKVNAGELSIIGGNSSTGINSFSDGGASATGKAGNIDVEVKAGILIASRGGISSTTYSAGDAGAIRIAAQNMTIDGEGRYDTGVFSNAGTFRNAANYAGGNGGSIAVKISDRLKLVNHGGISSTTNTKGNGGAITISANNIQISGDGSGVFADTIGVGNGGNIVTTAGEQIVLSNGGSISSSTRNVGNAGSVILKANALTINGEGIETGVFSDVGVAGQGDAGNIDIKVATDITLTSGGQISSATNSSSIGSAGVVRVAAQNIRIDGGTHVVSNDALGFKELTGIFSSENENEGRGTSATGNAGNVFVTAIDELNLTRGGEISTSTFAQGSAGVVDIKAANVVISEKASISSAAAENSSGQTGDIKIAVSNQLLLSDAAISIENNAEIANAKTATPTTLSVSAANVVLKNARITASSTGNVAASNIDIQYREKMSLDPSAITTSAVSGNGGMISVSGNGPLLIDHSQISTSVTGTTNGNGGDITISAPVVVLNSGFIQANTRAKAAQGGDVNIHVQAVLTSGSSLFVGGSPLIFNPTRAAYNAIQAAAPDGVNGAIQISSPVIDLTGSLTNLSTQLIDFGNLGMDLCKIGEGSSLTPIGRGGLLPTSTSLMRASFSLEERSKVKW